MRSPAPGVFRRRRVQGCATLRTRRAGCRPWGDAPDRNARSGLPAWRSRSAPVRSPCSPPGAGAAAPRTPRGVEHGVAVPPQAGRRPVHVEPGGHHRDREGCDEPVALPGFAHGPALRLLLRVPDGRPTETTANADLTVQPAETGRRASSRRRASPSSAPCGPRCTARSRVAGLAHAALTVGRPPRTTACCPPGRTTSPTTTTAGRSSSSGIRRARPCSSGSCRPRSTRRRASAGGWCPPSSSGATCRSPPAGSSAERFRTSRPVGRPPRPAASSPTRPSVRRRRPTPSSAAPAEG